MLTTKPTMNLAIVILINLIKNISLMVPNMETSKVKQSKVKLPPKNSSGKNQTKKFHS